MSNQRTTIQIPSRRTAIAEILSLPTVPRTEKMRVTRLWNYHNMVQDYFEPIRYWPVHTQKMMLREKKNNRDRYLLFAFLNGNGVDPELAVQAIKMSDYVRGRRIIYPYDVQALRQFWDFIRQSSGSNSRFYGNMVYYDVANKELRRWFIVYKRLDLPSLRHQWGHLRVPTEDRQSWDVFGAERFDIRRHRCL